MTSKPSLRDDLPAHWQLKRLKYVARVQTGMAKGKDHGEADTVDVPYLRVANVQDGYLALDDVATMTIPVSDLDRYRLQPGDVLMNEGGDFDKLGRGHVWHGQIDPCIHQNHVFAVRPHGVSPEWLNAWTGSAPAQFYFMARAKQSTNLASISSSNLMELPVPVPSLGEQASRLGFLYSEAAQIDGLIEKKTRFIELLREKRQALIARAVTRGINPAVHLKDSGIDWLGHVPEHWDARPLKHLARFVSGGTPNKENAAYWNGDIPWASAKDMKRETLYDTQDHLTPLALTEGAASLVPKSSVLVVVRGMILARTFPVCVAAVEMAVNQDIKALIPTPLMVSEFMAWLLRGTANLSLSRLEEAGHGTKALRMDAWVDIELPVPPVDEQMAIAEYIASRLNVIDALQERTARSIELLSERRSSLITATVTGQIDIPEGL